MIVIVILIACRSRVGSVQTEVTDRDKHFLIAAKMIQLWQAVVLAALSVGTSTSSRQFLPLFEREPRSLRDTFPFSVQAEDNEVRQDRQVSWSFRSFLTIECVHFLRAQPRHNLFHSRKWLLPTLRGKGEEIRF